MQSYDSFCTHPSCIAQNNIFFRYHLDNAHVLNHEDHIQAIHPKSLQNLFKKDESQNGFNERYKQMIEEQVKKSMEEVDKKILDFLHAKYFTAFGEGIKKKIEVGSEIDSRYVIAKLQAGNAEIVKHIINYQNSSKQTSFINYLRLQDEHQIDSKIAETFSQLAMRVIDILDIAFDDPDMMLNLENEYRNHKNKDSSPSTGAKVISKRRGRKSNSVMEFQGSHQSDSEHQEVSNSLPDKTKPIKKKLPSSVKLPPKNKVAQPQSKTSSKVSELKDESFTRQMNPSQQLQLLSEREIIINYCTNPLKTFNYIAQNFKNLTAFHIFSTKFATKENIRKIFKHYPQLQALTFNCNHEFQASLLNQLSQTQLKQLKTLQLKWGIDKFFNKYNIFHHFPVKKWGQLQRLKEIRIPSYVWNSMTNNESLWIESDDHANELKYSKISLERVRVLHLATALPQKMAHLKEISDFTSITKLVALNLRGISFAKDEHFTHLINRNKNLTSIIIYQCVYMSGINDTFKCLKSLPYLSNFSLTPRNGCIYLEPSIITELHNLENLHLNKINLIHPDGFTDSSNLKDFKNLRKLRHLNLYSCNPVFSDFFFYLDEGVFANLELLNIGLTQVDNLCIEHLLKMINLQYLNIDSIEIMGSIFLQICKMIKAGEGREWPLRYLSIEEFQQRKDSVNTSRFSMEAMREIGKYLPHLQYIYIVCCNSLKDYNFQDFKGLKTIALDRELNKMIGEKIQHLNRHVIE